MREGKPSEGVQARNYMAYQRGTIDSYQRWADEVGDQSYTFANLLPYFERSLNFTPPDNTKRGFNATPNYDLSTLGAGGQPLDITFPNYAQSFSSWIEKGLDTLGVKPINGFTSGKLLGSAYNIATINHVTGLRESSETAFLRPALGRFESSSLYAYFSEENLVQRKDRGWGYLPWQQASRCGRGKKVFLSAGSVPVSAASDGVRYWV